MNDCCKLSNNHSNHGYNNVNKLCFILGLSECYVKDRHMDLVSRCLVINHVRCVLSNPSSVIIYNRLWAQYKLYNK
jgi:hypothetical protein